jgi:hypothetical protein
MDSSMLESLVILVVGWFLGLLAPVISDAIKTKRDVVATYTAMRSELNEVGLRMVLAAYSVAMYLGIADREFLKWVKDSLVLYKGDEPKEEIVKSIEMKLLWPPEQLAAQNVSEAAKGVQAKVLVKFAVPFVDARVSDFHLMDGIVQLQLLLVQADVRMLDDLVDQSRTYFHLTFGQLEGTNYATVTENLRGVYLQYMKRCRIAADRLNRLQAVL